jgi:hypothetical protein
MFKIFSPLWLAQNYFTLWGGGGGQSSTTNQRIDPILRPYVKYGLSEAQNLYQSATPKYYEGQTYVSPSGQTTQALSLAEQRALAGSPLLRTAQGQQQDVISGAYLENNPYFESAMRGAAQGATQNYMDAVAKATSGASAAGRYGSNVMADQQNRAATTLSNTLANKYGELAYQNFADERGRQERAAAGAPAMANADYTDINQLLQVGQAREGYDQTALDADIQRFNFEQNLPYAKLQNFLSSVYGAPQGSVSTTQTSGGKIVCTMMNEEYGFGSFRNKIWLAHSANMPNAKVYEKGYHTMFLPLIAFAKRDGKINHMVKKTLEHIARHRTADIWKQKHGKRDALGAVYRFILEPICYVVGKAKGA